MWGGLGKHHSESEGSQQPAVAHCADGAAAGTAAAGAAAAGAAAAPLLLL